MAGSVLGLAAASAPETDLDVLSDAEAALQRNVLLMGPGDVGRIQAALALAKALVQRHGKDKVLPPCPVTVV